MNNTTTLRRITKLHKDNKFDKNIEYFKKVENHINDNKTRYTSDKINLQINGKMVIIDNDKTKFETFLNICNNDVQEEIITRTPYIIKDKEPLK